MELVLIKIDSQEWNYMWDWVASHPLNKELEDPSTALNDGNQVWQYIGSFRHNNETIHEFKHYNHPVTNREEKISVKSSENMSDEDIQKVAKIK